LRASLHPDRNDPLVLLPGTLCDARVFDSWLKFLTAEPAMQGRAVVPADMTGCDSVQALAARVLAATPGCFIPLGFSLGGIVALELARIAPERIAAMVLVAANARDVPESDHADRRAAAATDPATLVGDVLWPRYVAPARQDDARLRQLITAMAQDAPKGTLALQTEVALTRRDQRPFLAAMTMPALVLGGALDLIAPSSLQHELAAGLPNATLHIAPDAGHFLPLERPDFCARALADWLAFAPALH
jgi:pimeloyl-ACP methyl ester carboxylesterase